MSNAATDTGRQIRISSQALGEIQVDEALVLSMREPMAGFPNCRRYAMLDHVAGDGRSSGSVYWLQALESPYHAFVITDPWALVPDYAPEISDADARQLELRSLEDARLFAILTVPSDPSMISINLRAPIVVNAVARLVKQVVLLNDEYHTRHRLSALGGDEQTQD